MNEPNEYECEIINNAITNIEDSLNLEDDKFVSRANEVCKLMEKSWKNRKLAEVNEYMNWYNNPQIKNRMWLMMSDAELYSQMNDVERNSEAPVFNENRNTKKRFSKKYRSWCFTLNNYVEKDIEELLKFMSGEKYVFQEEVGENGTRHLQGVVTFKNQRYISGLKKVNERIHWEVCRNVGASRNYCRKDAFGS